MRTEDDLRAAFRELEQHTPGAADVLRAVYDHADGSAHLPRWSPRLPGSRTLHVRLIVATAVAVTAVAVIAALALGPAASSGAPAAAPTLRAHLLAAIDHARRDLMFAYGQSSEEGTWASPWYPRPGQQVRVHILGISASGVPAKDAEYIFTMPAGHGASVAADPIDWGRLNISGTLLLVDHARHAWGEWHHQNISVGLPVNPAGIRGEIAHGQLKVIGRTELRGHQVIELGITLQATNGGPARVTTAHLWVDAATYLPVRQLLRFSTGKQDLTNYSFLPPTAANLAKLRPVLPAGYQRATGSLGAFLSPGKYAKK